MAESPTTPGASGPGYAVPAPRELKRERKALLEVREERLRDLGGLALEMYKRDRFNAGLVVERCAELVAIEARVQEIDALLDGTAGIAGAEHARGSRRLRPQPWKMSVFICTKRRISRIFHTPSSFTKRLRKAATSHQPFS